MKRVIFNRGKVALVSMMLSSLAQAGVQVTKIENGTKFKVLLCDPKMQEGMKVTFQYGANGLPMTPSSKASSSLVQGQVCVSKDLQMNGVPADLNLFVKFGETTSEIDLKSGTYRSSDKFNGQLSATKNADGSIDVKVCDSNLKAGTSVVFQVEASGNAQSVKADTAQCAVKKYSAGLFIENKKIIVRYNDQAISVVAPSQVSKKTASQAGTGNASPNSAPVDTRKKYSDEDIVKSATLSARSYVKSVVKTIGTAERIRLNFFEGVRAAQREIESLTPRIEQVPTYQEGLQAGGFATAREMGVINQDSSMANMVSVELGAQYGKEAADSRALQLATTDVAAAIDQALKTQKAPVFELRQNLTSELQAYQGADVSLRSVMSMDRRMEAIDNEIQARYRAKIVTGDDLILADDFFKSYLRFSDLHSLREYRQDMVVSAWRGTHAFAGWYQGELRSANDKDHFNFYRRLSDSNETQNASGNKKLFEATFVREYDQLLTDAWNTEVLKVGRDEQEIREYANMIYIREYKKLAYEVARQASFKAAVKESSRASYSQNLPTLYVKRFEQKKIQSQTSAMMTDVEVALIGTPGADLQSLTIGDSIGVVLKGAINKGMKEGEIQLSVKSPSLRQNRPMSVTLGGLKRLQAPVTFEQAITMTDVQSPDSVVSIYVLSNEGSSFRFDVRTTWEAMIWKLARTEDPVLAEKLLSKVTQSLKAEWSKASTVFGNGYNKNQVLLLDRLVSVATVMGTSDKVGLQKYAAAIRMTLNDGKRPGWFGFTRDDYDTAMEKLASAQL